MLRNLSLRWKIQLITLAAVAGLAALFGVARMQQATVLRDGRDAAMHDLVSMAVSTIARYQAQEASGALSQAEAQKQAIAAVRAMRYGGDNYVFVLNRNLVQLLNPGKPELEGKDMAGFHDPDGVPLFQEMGDVVHAHGSGVVQYQWPKPGSDGAQPKRSYVEGFGPWGWVVGTGTYVDDLSATLAAFSLRLGLAALLIAACVCVAAAAFGFLLTRPLQRMRDMALALASGETEVEIPEASGGDEAGALMSALRTLRAAVRTSFAQSQMLEEMPFNLMYADPRQGFRITMANKSMRETFERLRLVMGIKGELVGTSMDAFHRNPAHQTKILSDPANLPWTSKLRLGEESYTLRVAAIRGRDGGYLGPLLTWSTDTELVRMADDFESSVKAVSDTLGHTSGQLAEASQELFASASRASQEAAVAAGASQEASAGVETVASAAEELLASIQEISRQVSDAAQLARGAAERAEGTGGTVRSLRESTEQIGAVVNLIQGIAAQTNLLALNATIEAARAGEAGRGFAVVANEVKSLASQTAGATNDIQSQIAAVQDRTRKVVDEIGSVLEAVEQMSGITAAIAAAVEEQGAATREISRSVQLAARGTRQMTESIGPVVESSKQTERTAGDMQSASGQLAAETRTLREQMNSFVVAVRAM